MIRIFVSDPISEEGLEILRSKSGIEVKVKTGLSADELKKELKGYQALLVRSETKVTADILNEAKDLKIVGRAGVGIDNIDLAAASRAGVVVVNVPGGNTISAAEHTMALLLSMVRNIPQADASMRQGKWDRKSFMGTELLGKTLGVVGLGRIGKEVSTRALGFGMKVIAYDPKIDESWCRLVGVTPALLDDVIKSADFITLHVPKSDATKNIINKETIAKMKPGVRIINCARGGLIDEKAMLEAIQSGQVKGAALDVFEKEPPTGSPLLSRPEIISCPHLGASTEEAQVKVAVELARLVIEFFEKGIAKYALNLPTLDVSSQPQLINFVILAERLGKFAAQLIDKDPEEVQLNYWGELAKFNPALITAAALTGVLSYRHERVTQVNALSLAKEKGIKINEIAQPEVKDYAALFSIELKSDNVVHRLAGTVFGKEDIRLVRIDDLPIDILPVGDMLVLKHIDKPGVVGFLGTVLGEVGVNIAGLEVGRNKPGGEAVSILSVDSTVPDKVLEKIRRHPAVKNVRMVRL